MNLRQTVESYWSVWIFNDAAAIPTWEPFDEGMTTKRAATESMRESAEAYPDVRFALVRTVNTRMAALTKRAEGTSK